MKKISQKTLLVTATAILLFSFAVVAYAQTQDYTVLAPLPGTTNGCTTNNGVPTCTTNLQTYLPGIFNFSIALAAVMAFAAITWAGIKYVTVETIYGKSDAKELLENALLGLLLVIGAWVILNTINPQILNFKLTVPVPPQQTTPAVTAGNSVNVGGNIAGVLMSPDQQAADKAILNQLDPTSLGPQITPYTGMCLNGQSTGCVDLNGLQQTTVTGLETLRNDCNCNVSITGGTETGHSLDSCHNAGTCVDIADDPSPLGLDSKIESGTKGTTASGCTTYSYGGGTYLMEGSGDTCGGTVASSGAHWHVTYP